MKHESVVASDNPPIRDFEYRFLWLLRKTCAKNLTPTPSELGERIDVTGLPQHFLLQKLRVEQRSRHAR